VPNDPTQVIDDLDRRVLRALRDEPRATLGEMAAMVGVSRTTFKARLDRLWESGLIIGHETQLDLASMGFQVQALVQLNVHQGELGVIADFLMEMPQVIEAFATTGGADVQCRVAARDTPHLQEILLEISSCPAVTRTKSSVILSSIVSHRKVQALDLLDL
jgi:DNA-binding Lrp family transcriptional regulator